MDTSKIKLIKFDKEPEFADLWDACLYNLLYEKEEYMSEISSLFSQIGISKESRILDSSAGTGFISLHLREQGYPVECMDPMDDEIRVFKEKAEKLGVSQKVEKIYWKDIPEYYKDAKFDLIFCRGNSFIYADGGWNNKKEIDEKTSLISYEKTLQIFYDQLKPGGYLYVDKFPDNEVPHKDVVAQIQVDIQEKEDLLFFTKKIPENRYREARMIRRNAQGQESGLPNMTFDLKEEELEKMMIKVGFKIEKLNFESEKHFIVWLAKK